MAAYYNEIEPFCAEWLRNLIKAGLIANGEVDERSIEDVKPDELRGFTQCHFFAGIGVWSYALRHSGWPDDRPVWTGSCPCQPFSSAGKGKGFTDERHLWPAWFHLIDQRRPSTIFGEQVGSKDGLSWLDLVQTDLEGLDYACGPVVTPAAGYGAPHGRHRIYFVGNSKSNDKRRLPIPSMYGQGEQDRGSGGACNMADTIMPERRRWTESEQNEQRGIFHTTNGGESCAMANSNSSRCGEGRTGEERSRRTAERVKPTGLCSDGVAQGDTINTGLEGHTGNVNDGNKPGRIGTEAIRPATEAGPTNGFWGDAIWLLCKDGKTRPTKPGIFPLAYGAPGRVGRLRAYGNCIVAPQAIEFIKAAKDWIDVKKTPTRI